MLLLLPKLLILVLDAPHAEADADADDGDGADDAQGDTLIAGDLYNSSRCSMSAMRSDWDSSLI